MYVTDRKQLEIIISQLTGFEAESKQSAPLYKSARHTGNITPSSLFLEQYTTPGKIAAELLWYVYMSGDISERVVCDLGAGSGILSLGALLLGAKRVISVEIDKEAIKLFGENIYYLSKIFEEKDICHDFRRLRIINEDIYSLNKSQFQADTVVMNPPFGIWRRNADSIFLEKAIGLAPKVYTLLKYSDNVFKWLNKYLSTFDTDIEVSTLGIRNFGIKPIYSHHRKKIYNIKVILLKISRRM